MGDDRNFDAKEKIQKKIIQKIARFQRAKIRSIHDSRTIFSETASKIYELLVLSLPIYKKSSCGRFWLKHNRVVTFYWKHGNHTLDDPNLTGKPLFPYIPLEMSIWRCRKGMNTVNSIAHFALFTCDPLYKCADN